MHPRLVTLRDIEPGWSPHQSTPRSRRSGTPA